MYATLILGGGPGGTGPLIWAAQAGKLDSWLAKGVAVVDRSPGMGGTLGKYNINSDSRGAVYLECLDAPAAAALFAPLRDDPAVRALEPWRLGFPPLPVVSRYLHRLAQIIEGAVARASGCHFFRRTTIRALYLRADGSVAAEVTDADGQADFIEARTAVLALGGQQDVYLQLNTELMPDVQLAHASPHKIIPSDALLTDEGLAQAASLIERGPSRRVVILGGWHSAFSVAWALTEFLPQDTFDRGDIVMLARRWPPIFYESASDAAADGYSVTAADICPRTQRVNRFGGLRGDGRDMWRRIMCRPGTKPEHRVSMVSLRKPHMSTSALRRLLEEAAVIIPAFGYKARTVPVFDGEGRRLRLAADQPQGLSVDAQARILRADGTPIPNLFGIGLGSGFRPYGEMGGEPSFSGQLNSLWLYQNDIGAIVYRGVIESLARVRLPRLELPSVGAPGLLATV